MIKYLVLTCLLPSLLSAKAIVYHDTSQEKALIDSYLQAFTNNNTIGSYYDSKNLIDRLFNNYQAEVYRQALQYLDQQTSSYPQAVIALGDNIQSYWDSHYLQGYLLGNAGDYGKLKFFSILGMIVGGVGIWKNPFASLGTLKSLNVLLPLAGGAVGGYAVKFFRKPSANPPEPQEFLRVATGDNKFSYAQKRNDYLYRLFSVGGAIAGGDVIFKGIAKTIYKETTGGLAIVDSPATNSTDEPPPKTDQSANKSTGELTRSAKTVNGATSQAGRQASHAGDEIGSLFKPALNEWSKFKGWLAPAVGTLFAMYAVNKASYYALRLTEIKKVEHELKKNLEKIDYLVQVGDLEAVINVAQLINVTVLKLVTLYEMEHLRMIVDFETEFAKKASQLARSDNDVRLKIEELLLKLTDNLPAKLTRALDRDNYRYANVGTIKHLKQLTYQAVIADQQLAQQPEVASIINSFNEERVVDRGEIDREFASYLQLLLADHYSDAQLTIAGGKLQKNIEILFQVATVFKRLSDNQQFAFLNHFQYKLEAKFHNISLLYENFASLLERNAILREKKFSQADLQATIVTYLDYYATDSQATTKSDNNKPLPVTVHQGGQLTSTRSFARYLAEFIGKSDTKTYNTLVLELLAIYKEQPERREAVAVLLKDIEEVGELHDSYYDSAVMSGIEGGFVGAFALVGARALAKLVHMIGKDLGRLEAFSIIEKFLGVRPWKQMAIFFAAGVGAGVSYHYVKELLTHKIYPQQALFASQKLITFELAQQTCLLNLEIKDKLITDRQIVNGYSGEQIQGQRELLATFVNRVQQITQQVDHLNKHAPQLQINHYLSEINDNDTVAESCRLTPTANGYAVSISPLRQDLSHSKSILGQHQRMLDDIEKNRLKFQR